MAKSKKTLISNVLLALATTAVLLYIFPHPEANQYKFEEGRPWNYAKLIAPFDIPIYPDSTAVRQGRDSLDEAFVPVFERNGQAITDIITNVTASWAQDDNIRQPSQRERQLRQRSLSYLRQAYEKDVIADEYGKRIAAGSLSTVKVMVSNTVTPEATDGMPSVSDVYRGLMSALGDTASAWVSKSPIRDYLQPNLVYDEATSQQLYDNEMLRFTAIKGVIQQGQTIIDKGAVITPQDYTNLQTYERMVAEQLASEHESNWLMWLGQGLYLAVLMAAMCVFLSLSSPKVWNNMRSMLFIMLSLTLFFLLCVVLESIVPTDGAYLVPYAILPILLVVFFDTTTALFVSLTLTLMCAGAVSFPLEFILLQFIATCGAVYSLTELTRRSQLLRTAGVVAACYLVTYVAMETMMNSSFDGWEWHMIGFLAVSAALSSMAYILMVAVERTFGFVSVVTLIELTDTNNPILRQLSQECPGTFQHSMSVATLAADAASKIGANEPLVRAGAMYHDIGKLSNPNFYTENQRGVNPHDALPTEKSAEIIIGHVNDGLRIADRAGLPQVIKDFIREHHGRGQAKYFYYTYCNQHPGEQVDPAPFTYPGPNPRSIETSLLMMADSVEAASRSLKEYTPEAIRALVDKIIDGQIADGLHNSSPLSFADVSRIKEAFARRLTTMYHARVAYPDAPKNEVKP